MVMDPNTENDKDNAKEIIKTEEVEQTQVVVEKTETPPIPVTIVNNPEVEQKQKDFFETYDLLVRKMKEALDLIPPKPGKLERAWLWFQKHAFNFVIVFAIGVSVGVGIDKIMVYNDTMDAVNKQIMEFKGDLFSIQPSSIKKYYVNGKKNISDIIKKEQPAEEYEEEPVKKTQTRK